MPPRRSITAIAMATRAESSPLTARRGVTAATRDQRLHLTEQRPFAFHGNRDGRAGHTRVPPVEEQPRRVGHAEDAVVDQLEAPDLVGRTEPVLDPAHHAQRRVPVALEVEHHVDQVLEHPGAGDRAVLRDMADQDHRQIALLGDRDQRRRDRPDLGDAAGRAVDARATRASAPSRPPACRASPHRHAPAPWRCRSRPRGTWPRGRCRCVRPAAAPGRPTPRR